MKYIMLGACLALSAVVHAADSADAFVFVNPDTSSFWRTVRNGAVTVPVDLPEGASSATLSVTGVGYSATYSIESSGPFAFSLPAASTPGEENTYELLLTFSNGATKRARVSLIAGQEAGGAGATRYVSAGTSAWGKSKDRRITLPIPQGATSLTLNGETVDTGLGGARGFFTISTLPAALSLGVGETVYDADISRVGGTIVIFN